MDLFLVRHAIAEDGDDDAARPLSKRGVKRFREGAKGLWALGVRPARVLHSPRLRAVQTAELLARVADAKTAVCAELDGPPGEELLGQLHGDAVALVGHQPHLSALLAWLVAGDTSLGSAFELKKGAAAHLRGEPAPGQMQLVALYPPAATRAAR